MFQLKRRSADMSHPKKKRSASATRLDTRERWMQPVYEPNQQNLPYLVEIQPGKNKTFYQLLANKCMSFFITDQ